MIRKPVYENPENIKLYVYQSVGDSFVYLGNHSARFTKHYHMSDLSHSRLSYIVGVAENIYGYSPEWASPVFDGCEIAHGLTWPKLSPGKYIIFETDGISANKYVNVNVSEPHCQLWSSGPPLPVAMGVMNKILEMSGVKQP